MRRVQFLLSLLVLFAVAVIARGYANALAMPVERTAYIGLSDWPQGARPLRVALLSDFHVVGPDMPPGRLRRIVARVNRTHPDLILLAGDFSSDRVFATHRYSPREVIEPLTRLRAPLGVMATLGNHDHKTGAEPIEALLTAAGIRVFRNETIRFGPINLAGADNIYDGLNVGALIRKAAVVPGPTVLFTHHPDLAAFLPVDQFPVVLAGHTHCGQIDLPFIGRFDTGSAYGDRFACGVIADSGHLVVVTAGLGTSRVPLRYGAPPDWWMVTLGPLSGRAGPAAAAAAR